MNRKILTTILFITASIAAHAQEAPSATIATDVVSQYVWRGLNVGSVSLQPSLELQAYGLQLSAWGNIGLSEPQDTKELDLTLTYTLGGLTVGITDYWFNEGLDPDNRYFKYDSHSTNHLFEATIGYDFGLASLAWYTNFAGNDTRTEKGHRAYSSYVEASVPFTFATIDWTATLGAVPFATEFYDTRGFAVTDLTLRAAKDLRITDRFAIPLFAQLTANPHSQKAYLLVGFTLSSGQINLTK